MTGPSVTHTRSLYRVTYSRVETCVRRGAVTICSVDHERKNGGGGDETKRIPPAARRLRSDAASGRWGAAVTRSPGTERAS